MPDSIEPQEKHRKTGRIAAAAVILLILLIAGCGGVNNAAGSSGSKDSKKHTEKETEGGHENASANSEDAEDQQFCRKEFRAAGKTPSSSEMDQAAEILEKRLKFYTDQGSVSVTAAETLAIEIPPEDDADEIFEKVTERGELFFISQKGTDGRDNYSMQEVQAADGDAFYGYDLTRSLEELEADGSVILSGSDIAAAETVFQSGTDGSMQPLVSLELTETGTKTFADATARAYAAGETIGIYHNGALISVPKVMAVITDGRTVIAGLTDRESADRLTNIINSGTLPFALEEVSTQ